VFDARIGDISGRGKLAADMREVWLMQPRFDRRTASSAAALINQVRFRAGYDFLRLRADCGEVSAELADWWEDFHLGNDEEREALLQDLRGSAPQRARRGAPGAAAGASAGPVAHEPARSDEANAGESAEPPAEGGALRKRRRRRRRPGGGGDGAPPAAA
jgi:poly(A) polymerase